MGEPHEQKRTGMTAQQCFERLDLDGLRERTTGLPGSDEPPYETEDALWSRLALAACGKASIPECRWALSRVEDLNLPNDQIIAHRTWRDWKRLARRVIAHGLTRVGADKLNGDEENSEVTVLSRAFYSESAAAVLKNVENESDCLDSLFDSFKGRSDPLDWFETTPLLAMLSMAACKTEYVDILFERAAKTVPDAPWLDWLGEQQIFALWCGGNTEKLGDIDNGNRAAYLSGAQRKLAKELAAEPVSDVLGNVGPIDIMGFAENDCDEGGAIAHQLGKSTGDDITIESMAGLRATVDPYGERTELVRLDPSKLETVLREGARVIVHEERPVYPGFSEILAFHPKRQLVRVHTVEMPGVAWRTWEEQQARMAFYGGIALILWPKPCLDTKWHDPALTLLGTSEQDVSDPSAGRARQAELTRQGLKACVDIPRAHQLHGEALLAQLKAGELEGEQADGPLEAWYARALQRFENAEWAHQVYAQALEYWGNAEEAAIAWCDAWALDEKDARNLVGMARNRMREGLHQAALTVAEDALRQAPGWIDTWRLRAELALSLGDDETAAFTAKVVLCALPDDRTGHRIIASVAEHESELAVALEHLDCAQIGDRGSVVASRFGDFEGALERAMSTMQANPGNPDHHRRASLSFRRMGNIEDAVGVLEYGISRCGPEDGLLQLYGKLLCESFTPSARANKVDEFILSWREHDHVLINLGNALSRSGDKQGGLTTFYKLASFDSEAVNPKWQTVKCHMRFEERQEAKAVLSTFIDEVEFPRCVAVWADLITEDEVDTAWKKVVELDAGSEPALIWGVALYLCRLRGDVQNAEALVQRLCSLPPAVLTRAMGFLADVHARRVIHPLMEVTKAHPGADEIADGIDEIQADLLIQEKEYEKAAELLWEMHERSKHNIVSVSEMEACLFAENRRALAALSTKSMNQIIGGGAEYFGDGFETRAMRAAASMLTGDATLLIALLEQAPMHPDVLARVWQVTRNRDEDLWRMTNDILKEKLPGLLSFLVAKNSHSV